MFSLSSLCGQPVSHLQLQPILWSLPHAHDPARFGLRMTESSELHAMHGSIVPQASLGKLAPDIMAMGLEQYLSDRHLLSSRMLVLVGLADF